MADALYDLLFPLNANFCQNDTVRNPVIAGFLNELAALSTSMVQSGLSKNLEIQAHSLLIQLQDLANRSQGTIVTATIGNAALDTDLPLISSRIADIQNSIPRLEYDIAGAHSSHSRNGTALKIERKERRRRALLLLRNVERVVDLMELPVLLSSALSSTPPNFPSALDIYAHIRRLHSFYSNSVLVTCLSRQAEHMIRHVAAELLLKLTTPSLKLAFSIRLVGWIRRVLSDIKHVPDVKSTSLESFLATLFLSSRLNNFASTIEALEPLRLLVIRENSRVFQGRIASERALLIDNQSRPMFQNTERYIKRLMETFREHMFGIISLYRGIFPYMLISENVPNLKEVTNKVHTDMLYSANRFGLPPIALSSFPLCVSHVLINIFRQYFTMLKSHISRETILSQSLYCVGGLGRLGCDFGLLLHDAAFINGSSVDTCEWVGVVRRHRELAGRFDTIIS